MSMMSISYDRPVIGRCCLLSGYCTVHCEIHRTRRSTLCKRRSWQWKQRVKVKATFLFCRLHFVLQHGGNTRKTKKKKRLQLCSTQLQSPEKLFEPLG